MLTMDDVRGCLLVCDFSNGKSIHMNFSPVQYIKMLDVLGFQLVNDKMLCYSEEYFYNNDMIDYENLSVCYNDNENIVFPNLEKAQIVFMFDEHTISRNNLSEEQFSILTDNLELKCDKDKIIGLDDTTLIESMFPEQVVNSSDVVTCVLPVLIPFDIKSA